MKRPGIGYIVETTSGVAYLHEGTLWMGGPATLFKSRDAARNAVLRTRTHMRRHSLTWEWFDNPAYRKVVAA